jgi:hypothetical protein
MEATCSSETSVYNKPARRHIQEDGILQLLAMFTDDSFREILAHFRLFYALVEFNIHANP